MKQSSSSSNNSKDSPFIPLPSNNNSDNETKKAANQDAKWQEDIDERVNKYLSQGSTVKEVFESLSPELDTKMVMYFISKSDLFEKMQIFY